MKIPLHKSKPFCFAQLIPVGTALLVALLTFCPNFVFAQKPPKINRPASQSPPGGLTPAQCPQFVVFGFDDNGYSGYPGSGDNGGLKFVMNTFNSRTNQPGSGNAATYDGTQVHFSMYGIGEYITGWYEENNQILIQAWHDAYVNGNDVGDHTYTHSTGGNTRDLAGWTTEISECLTILTNSWTGTNGNGIGIPPSQLWGFRPPYLAYDDAALTALQNLGFVYDCGIEGDWIEESTNNQNGGNAYWPYTLDNGSPDNYYNSTVLQDGNPVIGSHPGLWEMPVDAWIVPPDNLCAQYGTTSGARSRVKAVISYFDTTDGKTTGLDYNNWESAGMTKADFVATFEYTLDLHYNGNRAPFLPGFHSDIYTDRYVPDPTTKASWADRQAGLQACVNYALSKPNVRVVTMKQLITWLQNPVPLGQQVNYTITVTQGANGTIFPGTTTVPSGGTQTFTITPASGYAVSAVTVDGTNVGAVTSYVFSNVTANHTITASFSASPNFTISATPSSQTVVAGNSTNYTVNLGNVNGFTGTVTFSATGLPSGATFNFVPASASAPGSSTFTINTAASTPQGTCPVKIIGTSGALTNSTTVNLTVTPGGGGLPAGWSDADIGIVGIAGSASYNSGTFTVSGSGADIYSTADGFNYAYQSVSGNQTVIARVVSENGNQAYAKAGVMIRQTIASNSVYATILITPTNGVAMEIRPTTGASSINVTGWIKGIRPPQWVKLVRSGNTFVASYSTDGSTWTQIASTNVTMATSATAGLAVTAHSNTNLNTATLDNVSITGAAPNFTLSASPNSLTIVQGSNGTSTITVNSVNGFNGSVSLSASGLPSGVTPSFNPSSTTTTSALTLTAAANATTGTSTVTVTGVSGTLTNTVPITLTVNSPNTNNFTGVFQIQNEASLLVMNNQGRLTNGAPITQWTIASSSNLDWTFIATSNGYFQINSSKSGLDAVVQGASTSPGAGIVQWSFGSSGNDQWKPVQNGDGSYTFYNLHSGLVLADPGGSTNRTTQLDQETANGGSNQNWKLLKQ